MSGDAGAGRETDLAALHKRLFQVAYMMLSDHPSAEDIAQEAIARIMEHRESFRGEGDFSAWAYAIAVNLCRAKKQADRRRLILDRRLLKRTELVTPLHGPSTSVILHETYQRAEVALRALSASLREVFILHYIEGLPYSTVAGILGISQVAARLRAKRAREILMGTLSSYLSPEVRKAVQAETDPRPPGKS